MFSDSNVFPESTKYVDPSTCLTCQNQDTLYSFKPALSFCWGLT